MKGFSQPRHVQGRASIADLFPAAKRCGLARFAAMPRAGDVTNLLRQYIQAGVPVPLLSELSFWSCSCLPAGRTVQTGEVIYSRVNLYWQVVLTISDYKGDVECSFHLALSPLEKAFGKSLSQLSKEFPSVDTMNNVLEPGGQDQINLYVRGAASADKFMRHGVIRSAIRLFILRLMKKGASAYSRYHCLDLADSLTRVK